MVIGIAIGTGTGIENDCLPDDNCDSDSGPDSDERCV